MLYPKNSIIEKTTSNKYDEPPSPSPSLFIWKIPGRSDKVQLADLTSVESETNLRKLLFWERLITESNTRFLVRTNKILLRLELF